MKKILLVIIITCLILWVIISCVTKNIVDSRKQISLLEERIKLAEECLNLSLEMQKLIQEDSHDKKRMDEITLKRLKLTEQILLTYKDKI